MVTIQLTVTVKKQASDGEGGEATLGKNTSKADCGCALPHVPRVKSHPHLI